MKKGALIIMLLLSVSFTRAQIIVTGQDTTVYTKIDKNAEFPGGMPGLDQYLSTNLVYPESARKNKLEGMVFVSFTVEKEGNLSDLKILRGVSPDIDAEAIRVFSAAPAWSPGKKNGVAVRSRYTLPLNFTLKDAVKEVFAPVEIPAEYPGGMAELYKYINITLIYPAKAKEDNINGKVYVTFVVEQDGTLTDFKISKPLTPETDAEAIRILKNSKKWIPAKIKGLIVKQQCTVPITFQLDDR